MPHRTNIIKSPSEQGLFCWLLKAKCECLPQELQNRGIFPDVESIIRNRDIPTVRLWVAYMSEKFQSHHLFGWRMVDFLGKAGMLIDILDSVPLPKDVEEKLNSLKNKVDVVTMVRTIVTMNRKEVRVLRVGC
jgi:hypothetical protein